jgi:formimidoylglutamate deiminase
MPGFRNDHSHAFQRGLRGSTERINVDAPHDDFWTWRERMYALADGLDEGTIRAASERCFAEMLGAGYTSVTEFHYVHHLPDRTPYGDPNLLAKSVAEAAERVGIRLLLLPVAYARGGLPRFRDGDTDRFLGRVDELREWSAGRPLLEVGIAAHSVRAVPQDWLETLGVYAAAHGLPLHVHACEQEREIEECAREHGLRPIELLSATGFLGSNTTVVHATHADDKELDLLAEHGAGVCACPTTEGNLGDGFLPAEGILGRNIPLSIGSDSHVRLDPLEELRELETNARRLARRRNVLLAPGETSPTPYLLRSGWGRKTLSTGSPADFVEVDLDHPSLEGITPEDLSAALVFGCGSDVIAATWVAGERAYQRSSNA